MKPEYVNKTNLNAIDPSSEENFILPRNMYLGIGVLAILNTPAGVTGLQTEQVTDFYMRCRNFLVKACCEIKKRYAFDDPVLSKLSGLSVSNAMDMSGNRDSSLYPLLKLLPRIVKEEQYQIIDDQWRILANWEFPFSTKEIQTDKFWFLVKTTVNLLGEKPFYELGCFVLDLLILPHSNASCERVFSQINLIKTRSRNKLLSGTVSGLLLASQYVHSSGGCDSFKPPKEMINLMTTKNLYSTSTNTTQMETQMDVDEEKEDSDMELMFD